MPYIVGSDPDTSIIRYCIDVPDDLLFRSAFKGALLELTKEYNWEFADGLSEISALEATLLAFDMYASLNECAGRAGDMELIADVIIGGDVGYVEITNIPQTYAHLRIEAVLQSNGTVVYDGLAMQFNGDTGANYDYGAVRTATASGSRQLGAGRNQSEMLFARMLGTNTGGTLLMGIQSILINNYADSSRHRIARCFGANFEDNSADDDTAVIEAVGKWNNVAEGIDTIKLMPQSGTVFKGGSRLSLYGLNGS